MARTNNKYTSINFNHILHKDHLPSSSSSSPSSASYSAVANSNRRMLVLSRPSPKPLTPLSVAASSGSASTTPPISQAPSITPRTPEKAPSDMDPNQISLRPLGHTGPGPAPSLSFPVRKPEMGPSAPQAQSPKSDRFVPPHLRPGFVGREVKPGSESFRANDSDQRLPYQQHHNRHQQQQATFGSPVRYGQSARPKSGGFDRIRKDPSHMGRPRSSGNRTSPNG